MVAREFPTVEIDLDAANPGYGAGANRGIRRCRGADVLLLNSDTRLAPGALPPLLAYMHANAKVGVVGPRLINTDGSLQPSTFRFPSPFRPQPKRNPLTPLIRRLPIARERYLPTWSHSRPRTVSYVLGAAMAIRRKAFDDVGGFDESFFMYSEEIDLCWRMRRAGWETHFAPVTEVVHVGAASTQQRRAEMLEHYVMSSLHFFARNHSRQLEGARFAMRCGVGLRLLRDALRYPLTSDERRRRELADNIGVWRRTLARTRPVIDRR
jgi:N-acetylglucosaminyl-diphospho-decaprenol L-rhamnosyltransferase